MMDRPNNHPIWQGEQRQGRSLPLPFQMKCCRRPSLSFVMNSSRRARNSTSLHCVVVGMNIVESVLLRSLGGRLNSGDINLQVYEFHQQLQFFPLHVESIDELLFDRRERTGFQRFTFTLTQFDKKQAIVDVVRHRAFTSNLAFVLVLFSLHYRTHMNQSETEAMHALKCLL